MRFLRATRSGVEGLATLPSHQFDKGIVWVAIHPILIRLEGLDDLVLSSVEMPRGMTVLRLVTATDVATDATKAEMKPLGSHLQTLLAPIARRLYLSDLSQMATRGRRLKIEGGPGFKVDLIGLHSSLPRSLEGSGSQRAGVAAPSQELCRNSRRTLSGSAVLRTNS
jgi:hypothetical protein